MRKEQETEEQELSDKEKEEDEKQKEHEKDCECWEDCNYANLSKFIAKQMLECHIKTRLSNIPSLDGSLPIWKQGC